MSPHKTALRPIGSRGPLSRRVIEAIRRKLDTSDPDMRRAIDKAGRALLDKVLEDYDLKSRGLTDSLGNRWAPNSSGKMPIGIDTEELRNAIRVNVGPRGGIRLTLDHDDIRRQTGRWFFVTGTENMPARRPFPKRIPDSYKRLFFQTLQREIAPLIEKAAREATGGRARLAR